MANRRFARSYWPGLTELAMSRTPHRGCRHRVTGEFRRQRLRRMLCSLVGGSANFKGCQHRTEGAAADRRIESSLVGARQNGRQGGEQAIQRRQVRGPRWVLGELQMGPGMHTQQIMRGASHMLTT